MALKTAPLKTPSASSTSSKKIRTLAGTSLPDDNRKQTLALYEKAMKLLQARKYDQAHEVFNQMLTGAPNDLADRIRMYIATCVAQINRGTTDFKSHEERYDYAISLLNHRQYEAAREHFEAILLENSSADYAFYGLALMSSMTGNSGKCIEHLTEAIRLNAQYRFQARSDADFDHVADDPSFTELLYPEAV